MNGARNTRRGTIGKALFGIVAMALLTIRFASAAATPAAGITEGALKDFIKARYPWAEVEVSELRANAELPVEKPTSIFIEKTPPGRASFRLEYATGRSIIVTALVKAFDRVVMARTAAAKGSSVGPDDLYVTQMESSRIPKGAFSDSSQIIGKTFTRSIVANAPVTSAMVSDAAIVKRGHKITLIVESQGFSIRTPGELQSDASVGEHIKAMNLQSKKLVAGLLLDENTMRVDY